MLSTSRHAGLLLAIVLLVPQPARSQDPKIDLTTLALTSLNGRYRSPVTCTLPDGTTIDREQAVVFRRGPILKGESTVRMTFFGVNAESALRCYSLIERRVPDRRGVVYVTFRSHGRVDLGVSEWRRLNERGALRYPVVGGKLQVRNIGEGSEEPPRVLEFESSGAYLSVGDVTKNSDGAKLLAVWADERGPDGQGLVPLELKLDLPDGTTYTGYYLEDADHDRR